MTFKTKFAAVALAATCLASASASATTTTTSGPVKWTFDGPSMVNTGGYGTSITNWDATFDLSGGKQKLTLDVAMGAELVKDDGFWLVLNNGGNPKGVVGELAILYGDLKNNKITAYQYNGANSNASFLDSSKYLATYANAFSISKNGFSFNLDVTSLNSLNLPGWKGAQFGSQIGIWYHSASLLDVAYANNGRLTKFNGNFGWYDTGGMSTTGYCANGSVYNGKGCGQTGGSSSGGQVPEPASMTLLGLGLIGLGAARRRRG